MELINLINTDDIKTYTTHNIDQERIKSFIYSAQRTYLEPILGSVLYNKIIEIVNDGSITGTSYSDYYNLWDEYITPSVVYHALELYISYNSFRITDGGTFQYTPSTGQASTVEDINNLISKYKIGGSKFDDLLIKYLKKNSILFPEYSNLGGLVEKTNEQQNSGIYFGMKNHISHIRR